MSLSLTWGNSLALNRNVEKIEAVQTVQRLPLVRLCNKLCICKVVVQPSISIWCCNIYPLECALPTTNYVLGLLIHFVINCETQIIEYYQL